MASGGVQDIDDLVFLRPEHNEEMEVLQAIYDGDDHFKIIDGSTIQYKIGENEEPLSILVEIKWTESYPDAAPTVNLETFYNQHLSQNAKKEAMRAISEEIFRNAGDQQTYGLIEWMKETILQLIGSSVFDEICRIENRETQDSQETINEKENEGEKAKKESRKEQLTKAQKRREWDKMDKEGKFARGHDWVDVVKHLSQTGNQGGAADDLGGSGGGS